MESQDKDDLPSFPVVGALNRRRPQRRLPNPLNHAFRAAPPEHRPVPQKVYRRPVTRRQEPAERSRHICGTSLESSMLYARNAQRITMVSSSVSDAGHPGTMGTFNYTAFGSLSSLTGGCVGTGCTEGETETYDYNKRLQPVRIHVGKSSQPNSVTCLVYNYYSSVQTPTTCSVPTQGSGNNGSIAGYYYQDNTQQTNYNYTHVAS